jgi:hypothetical protein
MNPLNAELNPICHLLALAAAHHFVDVSRIRVKLLYEEREDVVQDSENAETGGTPESVPRNAT